MMKLLTLRQGVKTMKKIEQKLNALGYGLYRNCICGINNKRYPYKTAPLQSAGTSNYFRSLTEVKDYLALVQGNRRIEAT